MAAVVFPITPTANAQYGATLFSTTYTTYDSVGYGTTYTNNYSMTSQGYMTINSLAMQSDGSAIANIYIYSYSAINRTLLYQYAAGTYTFQTTPLLRLYNATLGTYVTIYNSALTTTVGDNLTGSITHSTTVNVTVPATWFSTAAARVWRVATQQTVLCTSTAHTATHTKTEGTTFEVLRPIWVRYADTIVAAKGIWVRQNDALVAMKDLRVDYNGTIL